MVLRKFWPLFLSLLLFFLPFIYSNISYRIEENNVAKDLIIKNIIVLSDLNKPYDVSYKNFNKEKIMINDFFVIEVFPKSNYYQIALHSKKYKNKKFYYNSYDNYYYKCSFSTSNCEKQMF